MIGVSAGNHAQALAWAAATEGVDALLVMWQGASSAKIDATPRLRRRRRPRGGRARVPRSTGCASCEEQTGRVLVHPFNDPVVIAGAGTVGLEILEDVPGRRHDRRRLRRRRARLRHRRRAACRRESASIAVEPEGSNALSLGLEAGAAGASDPEDDRRRASPRRSPAALPIECCTTLGVRVVLVSEDEICAAFRFLYERAKLAVEPRRRQPLWRRF